MVSGDAKAVALRVVEIGLLSNPIYFAPGTFDGSGSEITYEVEPVPNETVAAAVVSSSEQTLRCGTERARVLDGRLSPLGRRHRAYRWRLDPLREAVNSNATCPGGQCPVRPIQLGKRQDRRFRPHYSRSAAFFRTRTSALGSGSVTTSSAPSS